MKFAQFDDHGPKVHGIAFWSQFSNLKVAQCNNFPTEHGRNRIASANNKAGVTKLPMF